MKNITLLFFIAFFLLKFIPLEFETIGIPILTTHVAGKILIFLVTTYHLFIDKSNVSKSVAAKILLFYFVTQSVSIITAKDVTLFLKDYQNLFFNILIWFNAFILIQHHGNKNKFFSFTLFLGVVITVVEFIYYLFPNQFFAVGQLIIQNEVYETYQFDFGRDRYHLYLHTEMFLPFLIHYLFQLKKPSMYVLYLVVITISIVLSIVSKFRRKFIIAILGGAYTLFTLKNEFFVQKSKAIIILIGICFIVIFGISLFGEKSYTVIDRILLTEEQDIATIDTRKESLWRSIDLLSSSWITGVGMGNYQLYVSDNNKTQIADSVSKRLYQRSSADPHSIISKTMAETGIVGLIGLSVMIIFFGIRDVKRYRFFQEWEIHPYITGFWLLALYSLFSPFTTVFVSGLFWYFRGVIEGVYAKKDSHTV